MIKSLSLMRQNKTKQEVKTMATKMSLTKEQSLAVTTRGKVMVSASAGSGKTHTMLERIMHLIESGV
ncbi:MAG: UvrD-helicase domain-containing protein, partial [Clostridia bacterium]|nr:UvrD-helicase domain-containing protein [Clostridia bacterium]